MHTSYYCVIYFKREFASFLKGVIDHLEGTSINCPYFLRYSFNFRLTSEKT